MRGSFTRLKFLSILSMILCFSPLPRLFTNNAGAAGMSQLTGSAKIASQSELPWTIQADKLMYNEEKQLYEAEGNVKISSTDRMMEADYAALNNQTRQADLNGNVTVRYGRNWVKGEHIIWNLDTETGWLASGIVYFAENNFFVQGKSIKKVGPNDFELKEGFITSCNPADPDWKIQFNSMKVKVGDSALTQDASFWAKSLPIAYWPYVNLPVAKERQSGFLLPIWGDSTLNGLQLQIPYYWAMRGDMDATIYAEYFQNRGFMGGAEYRINNQEWGKGVWMFNYLEDQANKSFLNSEGYPFQTEDRYWVRAQHDVTLPWGIEAKIDLDYVSDRNFLQEFSNGSSSFGHSREIFGQYFGRTLLYDQTSLMRESDLYLEKKDQSEILSLDLRYWENLGLDTDQTVQRLPYFSYDIIPNRIDGTPLYYDLESSAVNYSRHEGDTEQRLDIYPRMYYPMHWGNYLNIEPSVGVRADSYAIQWQTGGSSDFAERGGSDVTVEMSSRLNREFSVDFWNFTALQHAIRPEISYEYTDQAVTSSIPQLDVLDLDQSRNGVRYGFSTFLTGKEVSTNASDEVSTTYREIVRFRAFQFFNIQPPPLEDPAFDTTNVMRQGLSPLGLRLDVMPKRYITVSYDMDVDVWANQQGKAQNLFLTLDSTAGHIVRIDYEQIPSLAVNEITVASYLKAYKDIYVSTLHDYSIDTGLLFTQGYGLRYVRGCWGLGVGYERVGSDNRFVFTVDLLGMGSLGGQALLFGKPLFGEAIPGYQHPESWVLSR